MTLFEVNEAAAIIKETAHPDVNLIFGAVIDPNLTEELRVTVIATGFEHPSAPGRTQAVLPRRQPVPAEMESPVPHKRPASDQPEPSRQPLREPVRATTSSEEQPETFPVRSFDKEDLDIPAFLRRRR
jgi:cell division protein FtsZ